MVGFWLVGIDAGVGCFGLFIVLGCLVAVCGLLGAVLSWRLLLDAFWFGLGGFCFRVCWVLLLALLVIWVLGCFGCFIILVDWLRWCCLWLVGCFLVGVSAISCVRRY